METRNKCNDTNYQRLYFFSLFFSGEIERAISFTIVKQEKKVTKNCFKKLRVLCELSKDMSPSSEPALQHNRLTEWNNSGSLLMKI